MVLGSLSKPVSSLRLYPSALLSRSDTFHNLIVLSKMKSFKLQFTYLKWMLIREQIVDYENYMNVRTICR